MCFGVGTVPGGAAPQKRTARATQQLRDLLLPGQHRGLDAKGPLGAIGQQQGIKAQFNSELLLARDVPPPPPPCKT